jgi:hypothetical protein
MPLPWLCAVMAGSWLRPHLQVCDPAELSHFAAIGASRHLLVVLPIPSIAQLSRKDSFVPSLVSAVTPAEQ